MKKQLQLDINNVLSWCKSHDIKISKDKTKLMVFGINNKASFQLYLDNFSIEKVNKFKFLGIYFDNSLTWKPHIDEIYRKCFIRLNILKSISGRSWGANCITLILFFFFFTNNTFGRFWNTGPNFLIQQKKKILINSIPFNTRPLKLRLEQ